MKTWKRWKLGQNVFPSLDQVLIVILLGINFLKKNLRTKRQVINPSMEGNRLKLINASRLTRWLSCRHIGDGTN